MQGDALMVESDEELYRLMRKGNQQAFAELYERREPALYRYALHMSGARHIAEEVTHEAFLQLIGPEMRFDARRGSLEAYLYGVARNLIRVSQRHKTQWCLVVSHPQAGNHSEARTSRFRSSESAALPTRVVTTISR